MIAWIVALIYSRSREFELEHLLHLRDEINRLLNAMLDAKQTNKRFDDEDYKRVTGVFYVIPD